MKIVVDSYAWVEIISGTSKGSKAKKAIEEAEQVLTPEIVLAELARKYLRDGVLADAVNRRLTAILQVSKAVGIDRNLALVAAKVYLELEDVARRRKLRKPSLFDAIVLATARTNNAKLLSDDEHFKGLPEIIWLGG